MIMSLFSYPVIPGTQRNHSHAHAAPVRAGNDGLPEFAEFVVHAAAPRLNRYICVPLFHITYILPYHSACAHDGTIAFNAATVILVAFKAAVAVSTAYIGTDAVPKLRTAPDGRASGRADTDIVVAHAFACAVVVMVLSTHEW